MVSSRSSERTSLRDVGGARLRPALGFAERIAVERVVEAAKDPARLRSLRGADAAARMVVAP